MTIPFQKKQNDGWYLLPAFLTQFAQQQSVTQEPPLLLRCASTAVVFYQSHISSTFKYHQLATLGNCNTALLG
jgi:hypothetical protein